MRDPTADRLYLRHMLDAIDRIESYLVGVEHDRFNATPLLQDGVVRQLQVLGEASKRISVQLRDAHPGVPWRRMAGMRDKVTHDYMGIDLEAVWLTARDDLPPLRTEIAVILDRLGPLPD